MQAATRYGINYSTAKAIIKENKRFLPDKSTTLAVDSESEYVPRNLPQSEDKKKEKDNKGTHCEYIEIDQFSP